MKKIYGITQHIESGITIDEFWAEYPEYTSDFYEKDGEKLPTALTVPIADFFEYYIKKHADREMLYCSLYRKFDLFMTQYGYVGVTYSRPDGKASEFVMSMYNPDTQLRTVIQDILHEVKQRYIAMLCQKQDSEVEGNLLGIPIDDYRCEFITRNMDKYGIECYKDPDGEYLYVGKIEKEWV